jgi:hypothetical protein
VRELTLEIAIGYLAVVALLALLAAAGVRCVPAVRIGVIVAEVILVFHALLDLAAQARGDRPEDSATHGGYLLVSVVLLPLLVGRGLPSLDPGPTPSRADLLVVALACATTIVVCLRLHTTWG